jgi:uncharacterized caspase-like protein
MLSWQESADGSREVKRKSQRMVASYLLLLTICSGCIISIPIPLRQIPVDDDFAIPGEQVQSLVVSIRDDRAQPLQWVKNGRVLPPSEVLVKMVPTVLPKELLREWVEETVANIGCKVVQHSDRKIDILVRTFNLVATGRSPAFRITAKVVLEVSVSHAGRDLVRQVITEQETLPMRSYPAYDGFGSHARALQVCLDRASRRISGNKEFAIALMKTPSAKRPKVAVVNAPQPVPTVTSLGLVRQRIAVLIGISKYQHKGKWRLDDLNYASADAISLAEYLKDPKRGAFDKVVLLTEKDATTANIKIALREKLRGVQPEDLVLVFWAGHGSPDPHEEDRLYLITHDTDPEHMAGTAYAMEEFRRDIAAIKAKRVMVMADACHSAGISDPTLGLRGRKDNEIVNGLRGVYIDDEKSTKAIARDTGPVRLIFTSCEQGEVSRESSKLGHGVFTHYLLQALNGEADKPGNKTGGNGDGKVSLGEMIEYTRDQVKRRTGNQQHPATAGQFDRNLTMRVVK